MTEESEEELRDRAVKAVDAILAWLNVFVSESGITDEWSKCERATSVSPIEPHRNS